MQTDCNVCNIQAGFQSQFRCEIKRSEQISFSRTIPWDEGQMIRDNALMASGLLNNKFEARVLGCQPRVYGKLIIQVIPPIPVLQFTGAVCMYWLNEQYQTLH